MGIDSNCLIFYVIRVVDKKTKRVNRTSKRQLHLGQFTRKFIVCNLNNSNFKLMSFYANQVSCILLLFLILFSTLYEISNWRPIWDILRKNVSTTVSSKTPTISQMLLLLSTEASKLVRDSVIYLFTIPHQQQNPLIEIPSFLCMTTTCNINAWMDTMCWGNLVPHPHAITSKINPFSD